jgi:hypothetical protein
MRCPFVGQHYMGSVAGTGPNFIQVKRHPANRKTIGEAYDLSLASPAKLDCPTKTNAMKTKTRELFSDVSNLQRL